MKLTVIILSIILAASIATGAAVAQEAQAGTLLSDLDSLSYRLDDLNNKVRSDLTDLNIAEGSPAGQNASPGASRSIATKGRTSADAYERLLTGVEKGMWTVQSAYDPGKYSNKDATAIESRMSYIQNRIDDTRNMINDMRIAADRIERAT